MLEALASLVGQFWLTMLTAIFLWLRLELRDQLRQFHRSNLA